MHIVQEVRVHLTDNSVLIQAFDHQPLIGDGAMRKCCDMQELY